MKSFRRKTLADQIVFDGLGLHSGDQVEVTVSPSESGIAFNGIAALPENVTDTSRCTRLDGVSTIEHMMSAFAALGITDADVQVNAPEMPAMDGASEHYFRHLTQVGISDIGVYSVKLSFSQITHEDGDIKVSITPGTGLWRYEFECGDRWPNSQHFELHLNAHSYAQEIAPARTFAFEEEMEMVRAAGLGKGLDETTAFVIGEEDYVNKTRFDNEPVRHKMLDLIGDLYLAGVPIEMLDVVASRSGHTSNVAVAKKLRNGAVFSD